MTLQNIAKHALLSSLLWTSTALAESNYLMQVGIANADGNGTAGVATLYINTSNRISYVRIRHASTDLSIKNMAFFSAGFKPHGLTIIPDINGNGVPELAVYGQYPNDSTTRTLIRDASTAEVLNYVYQN